MTFILLSLIAAAIGLVLMLAGGLSKPTRRRLAVTGAVIMGIGSLGALTGIIAVLLQR